MKLFKRQRYFIVFFEYNPNGKGEIGIRVSGGEFPERNNLFKKIRERWKDRYKIEVRGIIITNIKELSASDFKDYTGKTKTIMTSIKLNPVLFLDLDGTVRRSKSTKGSMPQGVNDIELMPGIYEKIRSYYDAGYFIVGVTNQGGVAFGYKTEDDVFEENEYTDHLTNYRFSRIFYAPCHPQGTVPYYKRKTLLRKPDYGMLALYEDSLDYWDEGIDWKNSLFVGDKEEDAQCAMNAGVSFMDIDTFLNDK